MITAVTVTYGDRWCYLEVLLQRLEAEKLVRDVVVVDNASKQDIASLCIAAGFSKPRVIRLEQNLGSAGGYKVGIEAAFNLNNDFILLLDDDVVPDQACLLRLKNDFKRIYCQSETSIFAISAYRESHFSKIYRYGKLEKYNFQGLNIFSLPQRILKLKKKLILNSLTTEVISQQRGTAYAGLFFHKYVINAVGVPNDKFVLYYDDNEFSYRILMHGGQIWLDPEAICNDICENYSMSVFDIPILGYLNSDSDFKIFYMVRNKTYLDFFVYKIMSLYYLINMFIFLTGVFVSGVFLFKLRRVTTIYRAVLAGCSGKLGMHPDYPLP